MISRIRKLSVFSESSFSVIIQNIVYLVFELYVCTHTHTHTHTKS